MIKLRALSLLLVLTLVACIPISNQVTAAYNQALSDGQTTFYTIKSEGFVVLVYSPDEVSHEDVLLTIVGDDLQYNSEECAIEEGLLNCRPGTVVDGTRIMTSEQVFTLSMRGGNIVANASYRHNGTNKTYTQIAEVR